MPQKQAEISKLDASLSSNAEKVGVVVIGRNEGDRLKRCLTSLRRQTQNAIVYVDSGSTDGSVSFAKSLDCHTVDLDPTVSFSMARARNAGFRELCKVMTEVDYVQFVDGDCEIELGWLDAASSHLEVNGEVSVICGRLREKDPTASLYNRLAGLEWQGPIGNIAACGGIAAYRTTAFELHGGFDESMIAGEEAELCVRIRQAGGSIWRLNQPMALHDADLTRFSQWWTRARRGGYAYAHGFFLHGASTQRHNRRQLVSSLFYGAAIPLFWLTSLIFALINTSVVIAVLGTAVALLTTMKPALGAFSYRRKLGNSTADAGMYAVFCVLGKLPEAQGILKFALDYFTGRKTQLIEYKAPGK